MDLVEREPEFVSFGHEQAWQVGVWLRDRALADGLAVAVDVRTASGVVLFHVSLPGATADQEDWIRRKSNVVFRFGRSSGEVAAAPWLDPKDYAVTGGSVPVRVRGAGVVAAVTVSGLASEEDHRLAVGALAEIVGRAS